MTMQQTNSRRKFERRFANRCGYLVPLASHDYGACKFCHSLMMSLMITAAPTLLTWSEVEAAGHHKRRNTKRIECTADDVILGRVALRWRCLLSYHSFPYRLPIQAAEGELHHEDLPPEHQLKWQYLPRHSARPVEPSVDSVKGYVTSSRLSSSTRIVSCTNQFTSSSFDLLDANGSEPG